MDFSGVTITGGMVFTPQSRYGVFVGGSNTFSASALGLQISNAIDTAGTILAEVQNVTMTGKNNTAASSYGGDKGIVTSGASSTTAITTTNLISNKGEVYGDTIGVGAYRSGAAGAGYGIDKGLFIGGSSVYNVGSAFTLNSTSKVSNTGVVSNHTATLTVTRVLLAAATYGVQNIIVNGGTNTSGQLAAPEWFDNNGSSVAYTFVVQGSAKSYGAAAEYGYDKAIFGLGVINSVYLSWYNRVNNTGYYDVDVAYAGTPRSSVAACGYGIDVCTFIGGYNSTTAATSTNRTIINNLGNFVSDATSTGFFAKSGHAGTHL